MKTVIEIKERMTQLLRATALNMPVCVLLPDGSIHDVTVGAIHIPEGLPMDSAIFLLTLDEIHNPPYSIL